MSSPEIYTTSKLKEVQNKSLSSETILGYYYLDSLTYQCCYKENETSEEKEVLPLMLGQISVLKNANQQFKIKISEILHRIERGANQ